jgi:hypothetical protein
VQALTTRPFHLLCCLLLAGCATAQAIDTRYSALSQEGRAWHADRLEPLPDEVSPFEIRRRSGRRYDP